MMFRTHKRTLAFAPLLAAVALITACDDDPIEPEGHADDVEAVLLTIGDVEYEIESMGTENVTIPIGATEVSAVYLDHDGEVVDIHDDEFELNLVPEDEEVATFTRTGAFSGTLNGEAAGTTEVGVELVHLEEGHSDFDVFLNVTVQ